MRYIKILILFAILFSLLNCEKESKVLPKKYPYVIMKSATASEKGVNFVAEITGLGNVRLLSHGFIWNISTNQSIANAISKSIDSEIGLGEFSLQVNSDLIKDATYWVRPFVQNGLLTVYGNMLTFKCLGSSLPEIYDFNPKNGDSGDTIIISGANFSLLKSRIQVNLGSDIADVISTDSEEIKFRVPQKLTRSGDVVLRVKSGENTVQADKLFSIDGQRITDFNPKEGIIGETEIEIYGTGFGNNPGKIVRVGGYNAEILQESDTKITIRLPYSMNQGNMFIEVEINGKIATSSNTILIKSRWTKRNNFPGSAHSGGYFSVIDNFGYLICGNKTQGYGNGYVKEFWKYDLLTDLWIRLNDFPGRERSLAVGFTINNEIYYGLGINYFNRLYDFWKYNIQTGTWTQLKDFPGTHTYDAFYFTLNNKGYVMGGDVGIADSRVIWEYEPSSDIWTLIGAIPMSVARVVDGRDGFFQTKDKAYILPVTFASGKYFLYEFSPDYPNFVVSVSEYPLNYIHNRFSCFAINQSLFIGDDFAVLMSRPDFWKYDLITNKWTRIESLPGSKRTYTNSFSYNGLGFVMFGQSGSYGNGPSLPEIWTYDPNK